MTERERNVRGPTNKDIQAAIESLAQAYHTFVQALSAREEDERAQRRYIKERLDQLFGRLEAHERKVDYRLDIRDKEFDEFKAEVEQRLRALEQRDASD